MAPYGANERTPKVHAADAAISASDIFIVAWVASAIRIVELVDVAIEFVCKNREDAHHDRLDQGYLRHTRNCTHRGCSNVVETLNAFDQTDPLKARIRRSKPKEDGRGRSDYIMIPIDTTLKTQYGPRRSPGVTPLKEGLYMFGIDPIVNAMTSPSSKQPNSLS
jgi:hypothetical protein